MKFEKICILGLGYIGLPTASVFATHDVQVVGVDINPRVVEMLQAGQLHIHEPGLGEVVSRAFQSGKLKVASQPEPADAFIIAVPTPFYEHDLGEYQGQPYKKADMRAVTAATEAVLQHLRPGNLVILESTSPPRTTTDLVVPILERSGLKAGLDFYVAYSPERVLPGQILHELVHNARVVGGINLESAQAAQDLYSAFVQGEIHKTHATTAEMVKLMENTYRDVNIAIANEFARLAERFGVDAWQAIQLASLHPRVKILNPGPGVGGHCISVDPWFFVESAPDLSRLIQTARQVNDAQPHYVVEKARQAWGSLQGKKIAALGLAYKPDVDDLRESPAVEVIHLLQAEGALVTAYEPFKPDAGLPGIQAAPTLEAALADAEAILVLVRHTVFANLTPAQLSGQTPARQLLDTVNVWSGPEWPAQGFHVTRLGVG